MKFTIPILAASALLLSTSVFATPQYGGNTYGSQSAFVTQTNSGGDQSGYYIWNDATSTSDWSIRWSGKGGTGGTVTAEDGAPTRDDIILWFGSIVIENSTLGTYSTVAFEGGTNYPDSIDVDYSGISADEIDWELSYTDENGYDGIDFSLTSNLELLEFNLGSSLFSLATELNDPGVASSKIYIGGDAGFSGTNVLVKNPSTVGSIQSFEIKVPEPSIIALFGLGLIGMGVATRRRKA